MHLCLSECTTMKYVFGVLVVILFVEVEHRGARYVLPYVPDVMHPPVPDESKYENYCLISNVLADQRIVMKDKYYLLLLYSGN